MSLEIAVICDGCGAVIAGGKNAGKARKDAKELGARTALPGGRDCAARQLRVRHAAASRYFPGPPLAPRAAPHHRLLLG